MELRSPLESTGRLGGSGYQVYIAEIGINKAQAKAERKEMDDKDIAEIATLDQAIKGMSDLAKFVSKFYQELRDAGLSKGEAIQLTTALIATLRTK